jgi:hypothetical protein
MLLEIMDNQQPSTSKGNLPRREVRVIFDRTIDEVFDPIIGSDRAAPLREFIEQLSLTGRGFLRNVSDKFHYIVQKPSGAIEEYKLNRPGRMIPYESTVYIIRRTYKENCKTPEICYKKRV